MVRKKEAVVAEYEEKNIPDSQLFTYKLTISMDIATYCPVETRVHIERNVNQLLKLFQDDSKFVFANQVLDLIETGE